MAITEAERVFGGIHEDALNDVIQAFCTTRPRHLRYGSPAFVPSTNLTATAMDAIAFPGVAGGIDWAVSFAPPIVDLHPRTSGLPTELTLGVGQISLATAVELCIDCRRRRDPPRDPRGNPDHDPNHDPKDDKKDDKKRDKPPRHPEKEICARLEVYAVGHLEVVNTASGQGSIRVRVDEVELVDVTPDGLESVLECLILMLLDAALSNMVLPLQALRAGAFTLALQRGPEIEDDQIKVYGEV